MYWLLGLRLVLMLALRPPAVLLLYCIWGLACLGLPLSLLALLEVLVCLASSQSLLLRVSDTIAV